MDYVVFQSVWNILFITDKLKTNSLSDIANYILINLSFILSGSIDKNNPQLFIIIFTFESLISSNQCGFVTKRSCSTSSLEFSDRIIQWEDIDQPVIILYFKCIASKLPKRSIQLNFFFICQHINGVSYFKAFITSYSIISSHDLHIKENNL